MSIALLTLEEGCRVSWIRDSVKVENKFREAGKEENGYCRDAKGITFGYVNSD